MPESSLKRPAPLVCSLFLAGICACGNHAVPESATNGAAAGSLGGSESSGGNTAAGGTAHANGGASAGSNVDAGSGAHAGGPLAENAGDGGDATDGVSTMLQQVVSRTVAPSRLVELGQGHYFLEFPAAAFGTLDLTVTEKSSATVTLAFGEKKSGDAVDANPGGDVTYKVETLSVTPDVESYRITQHPTLGFFARPDKLFATIPFRYVEISGYPGTLTAASVQQIAVNYPFDDGASAFSSSNAVLDSVWDLCKYSTKATTWLGVYVDGNRERCPYEADAYLQMLSHYAQDTQAYGIGRASLTDLVAHPSWPAEWAFNFIYAAWTDYMWTADASFLAANYAALQTKTLEKYARSDELINPTGTGIAQDTPVVDWPYQYRDGYDIGTYPSSVNAQRYQALVLMAKVAAVLGKTSDAADYDAKARAVYAAFQTTYFDSSQGTYLDAIGSSHYALHASAYPLACDLVPADKIASVASHVEARGPAFGVYGAQYVIEGLYKADEEDYALSLLSSTGMNSWYNMLASGSTITTEAFDSTFGDWSHVWGAAPANLIPRGLMGIIPLAAGFSKIQIKPQIGSLTHASVRMPTLKGPVSVTVTKGATYKISVTIPSGALGKVYVKDYGSLGTTVTVDGAPINGSAEGKYVVFDDVASGSHTFEKALPPP